MKEIKITIDGQEWQDAIEQAFLKDNQKVKIDGFRAGKAPKDVFIKKYGKGALYFDAADLCISQAYNKMLAANKDLVIVTEPDMQLSAVDDQHVEFTFKLTLRPDVKLGKYKGLKVTKDEPKVTADEVDKAITEMRNRYAENVVKIDPIKDGDTAIIDFEGFKDGKAFDGGKGENYSLKIGSNTFIPGFEEALIGLKTGDTKDINLSFPKDYHVDELKGQAVTFKVKINEVKETKTPELDQAFFDDLGMKDINDEKALKKQVKENLLASKTVESENKYVDDLLKASANNVKVDIPEPMINDEVNRMVKQYADHLQMQGLTLEQFYKFTNSNEETLKKEMQSEAHDRVLYRLMLEEIAKAEKIEPTDEEIAQETKELAKKYQMAEDEFLKAFGGLEMIKYDIQMRKAIEVLKK